VTHEVPSQNLTTGQETSVNAGDYKQAVALSRLKRNEGDRMYAATSVNVQYYTVGPGGDLIDDGHEGSL
jgi:hypothetical protein